MSGKLAIICKTQSRKIQYKSGQTARSRSTDLLAPRRSPNSALPLQIQKQCTARGLICYARDLTTGLKDATHSSLLGEGRVYRGGHSAAELPVVTLIRCFCERRLGDEQLRRKKNKLHTLRRVTASRQWRRSIIKFRWPGGQESECRRIHWYQVRQYNRHCHADFDENAMTALSYQFYYSSCLPAVHISFCTPVLGCSSVPSSPTTGPADSALHGTGADPEAQTRCFRIFFNGQIHQT